MSVTVTAVLLAVAVVLLIRANKVQLGGALVCVVFGLVLGATPAGPMVNSTLSDIGSWVWSQATTR
jgi:Kef-type K+ transport system membrane component KefB